MGYSAARTGSLRLYHPCCIFRRPEALRLTSHSDIVLGLVPNHHVFGLLVNLCTSLLQGCTVVNVDGFEKTHLLHAMDFHHVSLSELGLTLTVLGSNALQK